MKKFVLVPYHKFNQNNGEQAIVQKPSQHNTKNEEKSVIKQNEDYPVPISTIRSEIENNNSNTSDNPENIEITQKSSNLHNISNNKEKLIKTRENTQTPPPGLPITSSITKQKGGSSNLNWIEI